MLNDNRSPPLYGFRYVCWRPINLNVLAQRMLQELSSSIRNSDMFRSVMVTTRSKGRSKFQISLIFSWSRNPNSYRSPLRWMPVFIMSIRQSDDIYVLDVATPWNSSIDDNWWAIDLKDGIDLLDMTNGVTFPLLLLLVEIWFQFDSGMIAEFYGNEKSFLTDGATIPFWTRIRRNRLKQILKRWYWSLIWRRKVNL